MARFASIGTAQLAKELGQNTRTIQRRRKNIEKRQHIRLTAPYIHLQLSGRFPEAPEVINLNIKDGQVLIGSDAHYWPGMVSTAHMAMLFFAKRLKPVAIIQNGDVMDGARASRHAPIGWEKRPELVDEIECCQERLAEIQQASPKSRRIWNLGNHCSRFETRIATLAPEYARVKGVHLKDHFEDWESAWATAINHSPKRLGGVVVKHRWKSGMHAPHNNTLWAGVSYVTGHLHSAKVMPISDLHGTRWGVDCGTMAEPYGPQFSSYTESSPVNWRSAIALLTFVDGELLWPELIPVTGIGVVDFRGERIKVCDVEKAYGSRRKKKRV